MGRKQNRCSKKQREIRRTEHADTFNRGFTMGYNMGYEQGKFDYMKEQFEQYEAFLKTVGVRN